ncbi:MAG: hypothetical protein RL441_218 [Actinomycetota bacterium]
MTTTPNAFGRVDAENNVFVIEGGVERRVGQYPNVAPEEALAYFERKFADLVAKVRILEQRVANKVDSHNLKKTATALAAELAEPAVVGDIADLRRRVTALAPKIEAVEADRSEATKEQSAEALAKREAIAVAAEKLAAQDASKINWKSTSAAFAELFAQWQAAQKDGAKISKAVADPIWKRFSAARTKFEAGKRQYFAGLDAANKAARGKKVSIVEAAEALTEKGADAVVEYRKLLDDWKASGRSNGKGDDALWARFKAAGDAIYSAKGEQIAAENVEYSANLTAKLEILKDAASIDPAKDLNAAKAALREIQSRWEKAGKVPRDKVREMEDKLRAVENKVRAAEQEEWRKSDPAVQARNNSMLSQLEATIVKLEADLAVATAKKDAKAIAEATDALAARKAWLKVVQDNA